MIKKLKLSSELDAGTEIQGYNLVIIDYKSLIFNNDFFFLFQVFV